MPSRKEDQLPAGPVKAYKPPQIPTLEDPHKNLSLKTIPSRWKKNAAVIACLGFAGALTLVACGRSTEERLNNGDVPGTPYYTALPTDNNATKAGYGNNGEFYTPTYAAYPTRQEILKQIQAQIEAAEIHLRVHWGGLGSGPFYVAHLTEQEVLGFIRAKLEVAGLNFDAAPPSYSLFGMDDIRYRSNGVGEVRIDLFDAENNVAVTNLDWYDSMSFFHLRGRELTDFITERFNERSEDISFGVFYNPEEMVGWGPFHWDEDEEDVQEATPERKEEARLILIERITNQVDEFIAWLQAEGIV